VTCRQGIQNNCVFGILIHSLCHFGGATITIKGASPLLSIFSCNFSKSENGPKICGFGGLKRENMTDEC